MPSALSGLARRTWRRVDRDAGVGERVRDVAGVDRAVQLAGFAGLAQDHDAAAVDLGGGGGRLLLALQIGGLELDAAPLELGAGCLGRAQRLAVRHQVVAREAVLDGDDVAHLTELLDPLEQDHLHAAFPPGATANGWRTCAQSSTKPSSSTARIGQPSSTIAA